MAAGFLADASDRVRPATVRWLGRMLDAFRPLAGLPAERLTADTVERHVRSMGGKPNTQRHRLATLAQATRWAVRAGVLAADPLAGVRLPPARSRGAEAVISEADHSRLLAHADPAFKPLLQALWLTGARPGELAGLTADMVAEAIRLQHHKTAHKGQSRVLYLSPEALALFREQAAAHPSGPLFVNTRGEGWTPNAIGHAMRAACRRAGLPVRHAYGYRHSFATEALARGVPDATVAALLGHANTAMLFKHYSHLTSRADVLRQAAARVR
jgi:integrase